VVTTTPTAEVHHTPAALTIALKHMEDNRVDDSTPTGAQQGGLGLMIEWLRTKDKQKNEAAVSILYRVGVLVVEFLVLEVIKPGRRAEQCCASWT
jgi:hypothetical protein